MENNGFEKYTKAWNKSDPVDSSQKIYTEKEIKNIKMKTSQDFSKSINHSIVFDYVHKGILTLGMLLLAWYYRTNTFMLITLFSLIGLSSFFIYKEFHIQKMLRLTDNYTKDLSEVIKMKLQFYRSKFTALKLMLAFTNSLLVWVGSMFYFYSKYGYYKMEDLGDLIVSILMVGMAFLISYIGLNWQMKNNELELEEALNDIDEQQAEVLHLQLKRKKRNKMIMLTLASIGLFLFIVLLIIYLRQVL